MAGAEAITILVPTMNRSDYLRRLIHYYRERGFGGHLCIGDSSDPSHAEKNRDLTRSLAGSLNITYRHFPNPPYLHDGMVLRELADLAPTPFAVFCGDDDFLVPEGLEECATVLADRPDTSAAHGVRVALRMASPGVFGRIASTYHAPQPVLEAESARARWEGYMRYAVSTQYSVHRTEDWRRMYRDVPSIRLRHLGPELLPCGLSCILGKIQGLNTLTAVFQETEETVAGWKKKGLYSLITEADWAPAVHTFRRCIVDALTQKDGIPEDQAAEIFDREFWRYVASTLTWQHESRYPDSVPPAARSTLRSRAGRLIRRLMERTSPLQEKAAGDGLPTRLDDARLTLPALLTPSSRYHASFLPIYRLITERTDGIPAGGPS